MNIVRKLGFGLSALLFLLGCHLTAHADPIFTPTVLIGLAVSAATTAASLGAQLLLAPKPKPQTQDKNKLNATDIQASYIAVGSPIPEIYGKKQNDGIGGQKIGVNFFYLSDIRHIVSTSTSSSGGTGGGKGGRNRQTTTTQEHHYYQDIGGMVGMGPLEILEIRAGTKVLYKNNPKPIAGTGTSYEAESASLSGGANVQSDVNFSGGQKIVIPTASTATFSVTGDGQPHATYIQYKTSASDAVLNVTINGVANYIPLPNTFGRIESVMVVGSYNSGATTVFLQNPGVSVEIDKIVVAEAYVLSVPVLRLGGVSGIKNFNYENPYDTYDYRYLDNPLSEDSRSIDEYNYQPNYNEAGETVLDLPAGCTLRIYEGNGEQLPDPVIEAHYSARGLGASAHRHRCYFMLENFETTEYGGQTPQISVIAQHKTIGTLGAMYEFRAKKAGLSADEIDFSAFNNIPLRGFPITNNQSPKSEMERLNQVFDIDLFEDSDGTLTGVVPDETVKATLYLQDLDYAEGAGTEQKAVESTYKTDDEVPKDLNLTAFDPTKDYELGNARAGREVTVSRGLESFETGLVLTKDELQKITDRMHQKMHCEKDPAAFKTAYRHAFLSPTDLVKVENLDGSFSRLRVKARNGGFPGVMSFSGLERDLLEPFPRVFQLPSNVPIDPLLVDLPAHIVGTIIDAAILRTSDNVPGFYAACARTDSLYQWKGAGLYWERETGYQPLATLNLEATIGRTIAGADGNLGPPVIGSDGWDATNGVIFDLYHGEVEARSDAEVLDKFNAILIGDELLSFANAVRINGYPNRWGITRFRRGLKSTSVAHTAQERVVLLDDSVKFIPIDTSERGTTRNYKFVSAGQDVESASKFSFSWDGVSGNNTAADQITDAGEPVLVSAPPEVAIFGANWIFGFKKPLRYNYSAKMLEVRLLNISQGREAAGTYSNSDMSITLNNASGLIPNRRIYNANTGETIAYTGIAGNTLTGCIRGVDKSTAQNISNTDSMVPVPIQKPLGDTVDWTLEQSAEDYIVQYRWQNGYRFGGSNGWSSWSTGALVAGIDNPVQPEAPAPPPAVEPEPEPGQTDPYNPGNCFVPSLKHPVYVWMSDGSSRHICDVTSYDLVKCKLNGEIAARPVGKLYRERTEGFYRINSDDSLQVTGRHKFYTSEGKIPARLLKNNSLVTPDGFVAVTATQKVLQHAATYNLEVDQAHNYFVRGSLESEWKLVGNRSDKGLFPDYGVV